MNWLFKIIPHKCVFEHSEARGDKFAKFYVNRVCRKCGKSQHKDLRYGSVNGWLDGKYTTDSYKDKNTVEVVGAEIYKQYKR